MQGWLARWKLRSLPAESPGDPPLPLRDRILAARGLTAADSADSFLHPRLTHLHDPSLIPDLDRAADRLLRALRDRTPLVIFGDYDVDGVAGTAILYHTLREIVPDADVRTYVPHRLEEGYGLSAAAIAELAAQGARLIVTVDCGITALEPAREARRLGIDLIITDHHNPPAHSADLPDAFAIVHPRRPDSMYPYGDLCGAGVAYKLAWRIATLSAGGRKVAPRMRELLVDLLAFAALGSIADVVPLMGENRVIARFGLVRVKHSRFTGLRALVEAAGLSGEDVDAMDVGFRLGPRLNAAGRMGHARDANELFTTADAPRAAEIAAGLSRQNQARRDVEQRIFAEADEMAERRGMTASGRRAIVLAADGWHAGVVGIVCSRLVEKHCRPVILMNRASGRCHGSGRSIDGFNLHAALTHCAAHLTRFGGHDMAAGLHLDDSSLDAFTAQFIDHATALIDPASMCRWMTVDCEAALDELTVPAVAGLKDFQPCGVGNPDAQVLIRAATIADRPTPLGPTGKHLAISLRSGSPSGPATRIRAVAWNFGPYRDRFIPGSAIDLVVRPKVSMFSGTPRVEPEVRDAMLSISKSEEGRAV